MASKVQKIMTQPIVRSSAPLPQTVYCQQPARADSTLASLPMPPNDATPAHAGSMSAAPDTLPEACAPSGVRRT